MSTRKQTRSRGTRALLDSLAELEQIVREGSTVEDLKRRFPDRVRVRIVPPTPRNYSSSHIRALRARLGVSQAEFANLMGISRILAQSWEQGVRTPSPLARRLMDTISADPAAWLATLRRRAG